MLLANVEHPAATLGYECLELEGVFTAGVLEDAADPRPNPAMAR